MTNREKLEAISVLLEEVLESVRGEEGEGKPPDPTLFPIPLDQRFGWDNPDGSMNHEEGGSGGELYHESWQRYLLGASGDDT